MPFAPPKLCPGCRQRVPSGKRCAECESKRRRDSYKARAGAEHRLLYGSAVWLRLRALKLASDPFCQLGIKCGNLPITQRLATEVDHKIPVRQAPALALVWSNLQSVCRACHSAKTASEDGGYGNRGREAGQG